MSGMQGCNAGHFSRWYLTAAPLPEHTFLAPRPSVLPGNSPLEPLPPVRSHRRGTRRQPAPLAGAHRLHAPIQRGPGVRLPSPQGGHRARSRDHVPGLRNRACAGGRRRRRGRGSPRQRRSRCAVAVCGGWGGGEGAGAAGRPVRPQPRVLRAAAAHDGGAQRGAGLLSEYVLGCGFR